MTPSAKHFVTPLVLRATSGERVYDDFFSPNLPYGVVHTSLAQEADLILVAPASADFIARLAGGFADDLASCTILATRKPVVIAPAMNDQMFEHPITQQNIEKLKSIGTRFIDPIQGRLVCGKEAVGHIQEPQSIIHTLSVILGGAKNLKRDPSSLHSSG
jgi:phosphopantothenoylcysteine decarboxylase/phosphopantothenate--cysteine ligase